VPNPSDDDDNEVHFLEIYGRPVYFRRNMAGKPFFLPFQEAHPDNSDGHFNVKYPTSMSDGGDLLPHKQFESNSLADDDFFQLDNASVKFQELLKNYTFVLEYSGNRWYGRMLPPTTDLSSRDEEQHHAFWSNALGGEESRDTDIVIVSDPAPNSGSPVGVDFYEMRRRNENEYGPYGVLVPLAEYKGSGYFHCPNNDVPVTKGGKHW